MIVMKEDKKKKQWYRRPLWLAESGALKTICHMTSDHLPKRREDSTGSKGIKIIHFSYARSADVSLEALDQVWLLKYIKYIKYFICK